MLHRNITSVAIAPVALMACFLPGGQALAQSAGDIDLLREELARMRGQMDDMAGRIVVLENELASAHAQIASAQTEKNSAPQPETTALAKADTIRSAPRIVWKGAPELASENGWSFKPRGSLQLDAGHISGPSGISDRGLGFASEVRRARLGAEGTMPGGFAYRFEVDFSQASAKIQGAYLSYKGKGLTITAGQHNNFQSLEKMTSGLNISFMERAAFHTAFGFEQRLGISAQYTGQNWLVQAGVFTDNLADLKDNNSSHGADGRLVFMPRLGKTQLHLGGSVHYHKIGDIGRAARYNQRPFLHMTSIRFVDTGALPARSETGWGAEAAAIHGPFHLAGEAYWQKVNRYGAANPTFLGGYVEAGYFLTRGDQRGYKAGAFDRVRPAHGVGEGGMGALQLNLRYDYLDLNDGGVKGGKQNAYAISLIWTPMAYIRFLAQYGRAQYSDAIIATDQGRTSYGVDTLGLRAQFDF